MGSFGGWGDIVVTRTAAFAYYIQIQHTFEDIDGDALAFTERLRLVAYRDKQKHLNDNLTYVLGASECNMHFPLNGLPREMIYEVAKKQGGRKMAMIKDVPLKHRDIGGPSTMDMPAYKTEPHAHAMVSGKHASARAQKLVDYLHGKGYIAYKVPLKTSDDAVNYSNYIENQSTHHRTV